MALDVDALFKQAVTAGAATAGAQWRDIQMVATQEFRSFCSRVVQIVDAVAAGEVNRNTAKKLLKMSINSMVATIAMLTTLVAAAVDKVVNAVVGVLKSAVNLAAGFPIL